MALTATMHRIALNVSDMDRHHYADHALKVARHPSETDERMMVRVLAFALHAGEQLAFGSGLSNSDEPALWEHSLAGEVELWVDVGNPDARRIRQACGRAAQVQVYAYGDSRTDIWWRGIADTVARHGNLQVHALDDAACAALAAMASRNLALQVLVQDGGAWVSDGEREVQVTPRRLFPTA